MSPLDVKHLGMLIEPRRTSSVSQTAEIFEPQIAQIERIGDKRIGWNL